MLYIHVPFCKSRCIYCNFFSTTKMELRRLYVDVIIRQLTALQPTHTDTVYLGSGTTSVIERDDLQRLLEECRKMLDGGGEFTVECNPDDVTDELAETLQRCGVNRVSLGIQTFNDERLKLINRRHSADKAREAVNLLRARNINNVSIDLMFGFPAETDEEWIAEIEEAIRIKPNHISAYCLTVEEGTVLHKRLSDGSLPPLPDEDTLERQYYTLCQKLKSAGYEHYEISNFCLPGFHSRHNSVYWRDNPYLALGAGAHGLEIIQLPSPTRKRYWNICDINEFIRRVNEGISVIDGSEDIDSATHYNDLITTAMRTNQGLSAEHVRKHCSPTLADYFTSTAKRLASKGLVEIISDKNDTIVRLSPNKLFVSDGILAELIFS